MQDDGTLQIWLVSGCVTLCTFWTSPHQGGRRLWHFFMLKLSTFSSVLFQMPRLHQIRSSQLSPGKYLMPFTRKGKRERTQYVAEKGVKKFFHFRAADESFE